MISAVSQNYDINRNSSNIEKSSLYIPALDGLRFLAFLLVFIHHAPYIPPILFIQIIHDYGWVGVEIFFSISSYLFFHLLRAEEERKGRISIRRFYARRLLRIYPLMAVYAIGMVMIFGSQDKFGIVRLGGILTLSDNIITWIRGYNTSIYASAHLWTLAFEAQLYLLIPLSYLASRRWGNRSFLIAMLAVWLFCLTLRVLVTLAGAPHPIVWVTGFLQPEAFFAGICLAIIRPRWPWVVSLLVSLFSGIIFFSNPFPWISTYAAVLQYPMAALMCVSFMDATLRSTIIGRFFSLTPFRILGTISFGLYVFHIISLNYSSYIIQKIGLGDENAPWANMIIAFTLTVAAATLSYIVIERPFLKIKSRVSSVHGREITRASI